MTQLLSIILAAGEGTRMKSALPKVLHEVGGMPIVGHVARAARAAGSERIAVITGPGHDSIRKSIAAIDPQIVFFEQTERKGTGHAASMARELFKDAEGYVAVL
ncbi:MAG: NTP transferase domain-containing protein, partial [Cypionkella sp.]